MNKSSYPFCLLFYFELVVLIYRRLFTPSGPYIICGLFVAISTIDNMRFRLRGTRAAQLVH
jgi:hypothetical protein